MKNFIQQKLIEKCNREGISVNQVSLFFFLASLEAKHFYKASMSYINIYKCYSRFKSPNFKSKRLSLCILKKTPLRGITQICFLHKFSLMFYLF